MNVTFDVYISSFRYIYIYIYIYLDDEMYTLNIYIYIYIDTHYKVPFITNFILSRT